MRIHSVIMVISFAVMVAAGAVWMKSRATAVELQARLAALTIQQRNTSRALEQERDRLRSELTKAMVRRQADASATFPPQSQPAPLPAVVSPLPLGEWRASRELRNEGQSTPRGTVATLLWAAAGGDLATTMQIIAFDEAGRKQAQAFFDTLPPAARQSFPTPEALIASLTIAAVPNNAAQLSWFHERDADHATVDLLLGTPDQTASTEITAAAAKDNRPPMHVDRHATKLTVLSLQRSTMGWRVVIPAAAIERLARLYKPPTT